MSPTPYLAATKKLICGLITTTRLILPWRWKDCITWLLIPLSHCSCDHLGTVFGPLVARGCTTSRGSVFGILWGLWWSLVVLRWKTVRQCLHRQPPATCEVAGDKVRYLWELLGLFVGNNVKNVFVDCNSSISDNWKIFNWSVFPIIPLCW